MSWVAVWVADERRRALFRAAMSGGVHDPGQPRQRRVAGQVVVVDEDLEGALAVAVGAGRRARRN